jgi:hypothetical protein
VSEVNDAVVVADHLYVTVVVGVVQGAQFFKGFRVERTHVAAAESRPTAGKPGEDETHKMAEEQKRKKRAHGRKAGGPEASRAVLCQPVAPGTVWAEQCAGEAFAGLGCSPLALDGGKQFVSFDTAAVQSPRHEGPEEAEPAQTCDGPGVGAEHVSGAEDAGAGAQGLRASEDVGLVRGGGRVAQVDAVGADDGDKLGPAFGGEV